LESFAAMRASTGRQFRFFTRIHLPWPPVGAAIGAHADCGAARLAEALELLAKDAAGIESQPK
jgi:hypothetical protein